MADKTIGELPVAEELYNDSLLVVEQQREARSIRGELVANFAREAAAADVQRAVDAAASAEKSADSAKTDADRAEEMRQSIELDYEYIDTARTEAQASAKAAGESQEKAKASEDASKVSQDEAAKSEQNAAGSAEQAKTSEDAAKASQEAAQLSQEEASASESAAATYANAAKGSETNAGESASAAAKSAADGSKYATAAQSYTEGNTGSREGEDVDNAKYYYDQAKRISQGLAGALLPMGTVTFEELKTQIIQAGYMYNISNDFTTDETFREGAGHAYPAGTNVYYTADGKWDCLAGAQVVSVNGQTGAVIITPASIGAYTKEEVDARSGVTSVNGGTGAVTVTPQNIGAVAKTGDTMTGPLNIGDFLTLYSDTEGGNINIHSPAKYGNSWEIDAFDGNLRIVDFEAGGKSKVPLTLNTGGNNLNVGGKVNLYTDGEGGNIGLTGSGGRYWEIDANGDDLRFLTFLGSDPIFPLVLRWKNPGESYFAGTANRVSNPLTFTGSASGSYDGSAAKSVNIPPAVAVKGDRETNYRTGNVNLTPGNIGAVSKTGDTMTGDLTVTNSSQSARVGMAIGSDGKVAGLYSSNYSTWLVYCNANGHVYVHGKPSEWWSGLSLSVPNATLNGYISSGSQEIVLCLPVGRPITAPGVSVSSMTGVLRGVGGYIQGSSNINFKSGYTTSAYIDDDAGLVWIHIIKSSAFDNATNNTPVVFKGDITVSFTATADEPMPGPEIFDDPTEFQIDVLKNKLAATDYVVIKIAEGAATEEEYADVIAQRKEWRAQINELEAEQTAPSDGERTETDPETEQDVADVERDEDI